MLLHNCDYLFMQYDLIAQQNNSHIHHQQTDNLFLLEEIDSRHNQKLYFDNTQTIPNASKKQPSNSQPFLQDPSMDIFEQSDRKERDLPLFYKLSQDYKEQEDKARSNQKVVKMQIRRQKNDTKNIPKNFGKGIMNFIEKNERKVKNLLTQHNLNHLQFFKLARNQKKTINTIADLRRLWTTQKFGKVMRMVSNLFLREYAIENIFNSRITSYATHIKYRHILLLALRNPSNFNHIKQF